MRFLVLACLFVATPATAQSVSDEVVKGLVEPGQELESRTDGDLNGDGFADVVLVDRSEEKRQLSVYLSVKGDFDFDFQKAGTLSLDPYPLGPADVTIAKGVLKIEDLTGGTGAIQTIYRFRLAPGGKPRMRLIGLDGTLYSRTYAHDGAEFSWNLLTGDYVARTLKLKGSGENASYDKVGEKKNKKASGPLYMETSPDSAKLLGWGE